MRITGAAAPRYVLVPRTVLILCRSRRVCLSKDTERRRGTKTLLLSTLVAVALLVCESDHLSETEAEPFVHLVIKVESSRETLIVRADYYTFLVVVTETCIYLGFFVTCRKAYLVVVLEGVTEKLVSPVCAGVSCRVDYPRSPGVSIVTIRIAWVDEVVSIISSILQIFDECRTIHHLECVLICHL